MFAVLVLSLIISTVYSAGVCPAAGRDESQIALPQNPGTSMYSANPRLCYFEQDNGWWAGDTRWFLSCLSGNINDDLRRIDSLVGERTDLLAQDFLGTDCWNAYQAAKSWDSLDQSSATYDFFGNLAFDYFDKVLQDKRNNFFTSQRDTSRIQSILDTTKSLFWDDLANNPEPSKCLVSKIQDRFLGVMGTCMGNKMGFNGPIYVPDSTYSTINAVDPAKKDYLRQFVEAYIKGYVLLRNCDNVQKDFNCKTSRARQVEKINKITSDRVLACAQDNYQSCPENYDMACPYAHACIMTIIQKPKLLFKNEGFVKELVGDCFSNGQPGLLVSVLQKGAKLVNDINALSDEEKGAFGKFVESTVKSHFPAEFCGNSRLNLQNAR